MIQVTAITHPGKVKYLEKLILTKNGVQLELTQEEWEELRATLDCKRETFTSREMDGYHPKTMFVFNNP